MKKPTRTPLSEEQLADAKRLSDIYKARARESKVRGDNPPLTQTEVGEQCGWNSPQSTVSQYMNGKVALNLDALVKLGRVLEFEPADVSPTLANGVRVLPSTNYDQLGSSESRISDNGAQYQVTPAGVFPLPDDGDIDEDRYAHIPQYTAMAAAGDGHDNPHVEVRSTLAFKKEWLRIKGVKAENLQVIYANGDSMMPTINDHDVLLVDSSRVEPADGGVFVVESATDGTLVKRLVKGAMGSWTLRSDNAEYADRFYLRSESNEHRIVGRVIWRGGDL